jgi:cystathionine gamma-lyase
MKFGTKAIHAGEGYDKQFGSINVPIYLSTTYVQESPGVHKGYDYSRTSNPTRKALEEKLAHLEEGQYCQFFSSGCAATTTIAHLFKAGDHILTTYDVYGGTYRLFSKVIQNNGIEFSYVDLTNLNNLKENIKKNTKAIWIESPTNPLLKVLDIEAIASISKKNGLICIVDNTFMTPYFQKPLTLGADIVVHSGTKYLNGHCDVLCGAVVTSNKEIAEKLFFLQNSIGAILGMFDCYLVSRGLKTLHVRMKQHEENANKIANYLVNHSKVEEVFYPGLLSHKQHIIAKKQATGFGGMVSFKVKNGEKGAKRFLESLKIFACAESLGGVESLACYPPVMTHASIPKEEREKIGITDNLIRLSIGIEDCDDLIFDLKNALDKI